MADPIRSNPARLGRPSLRGSFIVQTWRGKPHVQRWPRKRGPYTDPGRREQNLWMQFTAWAWKYAAASQRVELLAQARRGPVLDRDAFVLGLQGKLYDLHMAGGQVVTRRQPMMERVVFSGCILKLASTVGMADGVEKTIPWPLPDLDTFEFWSAGQPDRLTIPTNVRVVEVTADVLISGASAGDVSRADIYVNGVSVARATSSDIANHSMSVSTGAMIVDEGDVIEVRATGFGFVPTVQPAGTRASLTVLDTELVGAP